jgi:hypothetical protein
MHPDNWYRTTAARLEEDRVAADRRRQLPRRARPPSPRHRLARSLAVAAASLAEEPLVVTPRRRTSRWSLPRS